MATVGPGAEGQGTGEQQENLLEVYRNATAVFLTSLCLTLAPVFGAFTETVKAV